MSELQIAAVLFLVTFAVLFSGVPIAFGLTAVAVGFLAIFGNEGALAAVPKSFISELSSFALLTLPMFVVLGAAIGMSRAGKDIYESLHRWLHRVPGGLVIANIFACGLFSAMCGSSPATAAAIGKAGIPAMLQRGVPARLAAGSIAAGGSLGILIPPSMTFIIYGIVTETSIGRLFLAGVVPGILLVLLFSVYSWFASIKETRQAGPVVHEHYSLRDKLAGLVRTFPFLAIIVAVTTVMYGGFATPSEVAGIAAFMALVLVILIYRTRLSDLWAIMRDASRESSMILLIVAAAALYSYMMSYLYVTQSVADWMFGWNLGTWQLVVVLNLFLLLAGFFMPAVAIILMSMPFLLPVLTQNHVDLVWFGVILTINLEIGLIHPPVGLNLFVIRGIAPQVPLRDVMLGVVPFIVIMLLFIAMLTVFPQVVTWLPDTLMGRAL
ncbi:TRAP transporter large permease [Massilia sp. LXY-6]|uniref:TRAP transporter large permease n=1 Tax=Massilia sp. LXY-6 TaxID=3379823 RepID=UPI003EE2CC75